jgi:hypothetical protein
VSGSCPVTDPKFYEKWDLVTFGTSEYDQGKNKKKKTK